MAVKNFPQTFGRCIGAHFFYFSIQIIDQLRKKPFRKVVTELRFLTQLLGLITYSFPYIMLQLNEWTSLLADIFLGRINISNQFQILVSLIILIQYKLSFSFTYNTTIFGNLRFWHMLTDKSAVVGHESNVYVQVWSKCMILIESRKAVLFSETDLIRQRDLH